MPLMFVVELEGEPARLTCVSTDHVSDDCEGTEFTFTINEYDKTDVNCTKCGETYELAVVQEAYDDFLAELKRSSPPAWR